MNIYNGESLTIIVNGNNTGVYVIEHFDGAPSVNHGGFLFNPELGQSERQELELFRKCAPIRAALGRHRRCIIRSPHAINGLQGAESTQVNFNNMSRFLRSGLVFDIMSVFNKYLMPGNEMYVSRI